MGDALDALLGFVRRQRYMKLRHFVERNADLSLAVRVLGVFRRNLPRHLAEAREACQRRLLVAQRQLGLSHTAIASAHASSCTNIVRIAVAEGTLDGQPLGTRG